MREMRLWGRRRRGLLRAETTCTPPAELRLVPSCVVQFFGLQRQVGLLPFLGFSLDARRVTDRCGLMDPLSETMPLYALAADRAKPRTRQPATACYSNRQARGKQDGRGPRRDRVDFCTGLSTAAVDVERALDRRTQPHSAHDSARRGCSPQGRDWPLKRHWPCFPAKRIVVASRTAGWRTRFESGQAVAPSANA